MADLFDLNTSAGQFRALVLIYLVAIALRCFGFAFMEQDHTLIMGALLTLLRGHIGDGKV